MTAEHNEWAKLDNSDIKEIVNELFVKRKKFCYEQDHYPGIYTEDLQVGDRLYLFTGIDGYVMSTQYWVEIEITHLYGGVIFYKVVDRPTDDARWNNERHMEDGCISVKINLFPKKVVITKDYEFTCVCPRVEFIYDEDETHKYPSVFENTDERRYI